MLYGTVAPDFGLCFEAYARVSLYGTVAPGFGFCFEAYALVFLYGFAWMFLQAMMVLITRPSETFGMMAFTEAAVAGLFPFLSDPADTVKDMSFAGIALAGGTRSSQLIGIEQSPDRHHHMQRCHQCLRDGLWVDAGFGVAEHSGMVPACLRGVVSARLCMRACAVCVCACAWRVLARCA